MENKTEWIMVEDGLPKMTSKVIGYDTDSMTPEKLLLFDDGRFYFEAHGKRLDYTDFISKWKPINHGKQD